MGQQSSASAKTNPDADADVGTGVIPTTPSGSTFKLKRLTGRQKPSPSPSLASPTSEPPKTEPLFYPERWHILNLPVEVRNHIYSYILTFPSPLIIYRASSTRVRKTTLVPPYPYRLDLKLVPLFLTNKQVSHEARMYFYAHNAFSVPNPAQWPPNWARLPLMQRWFIDRIGRQNASVLKHLRVVFPLDPGNYARWEKSGDKWGVLKGRRRSLFPGLAAICPNLTGLEFEPRSGSLFVRYLMSCLPDARRRTLRIISEELRAEFPVLEELIIHLFDLQYQPALTDLAVVEGWPERREPWGNKGGTLFKPTIEDIIPVELGIGEPVTAETRLGELGWTIRPAGRDFIYVREPAVSGYRRSFFQPANTIYQPVRWWGPEEMQDIERKGVEEEEYRRPVPRVRYRSIDLGERAMTRELDRTRGREQARAAEDDQRA